MNTDAFSVTSGQLYPPDCISQKKNVEQLLQATENTLRETLSTINDHGKYCRADALAEAITLAEAQKRPQQSDALRALALQYLACDAAPYYAAAQVFEQRSEPQLAACLLEKALALAARPETKERLRREYASLVKGLPAAPLDQLQCSRIVGVQIEQHCAHKRGNKNISVEDAAAGKTATKIHFDTDSDTLRSDGLATINTLIAGLRHRPESAEVQRVYRKFVPQATMQNAQQLEQPAFRAIRIVGHADARGSDSHNLDLSQRRAEQVRQALIAAFPGIQITSEGKGARELLYPDASEESEHQVNRRVEIIVQ